MRTQSGKLKASWQVRLDEVELPDRPPAGSVLLRIEACGICGTDLTAATKNADWGPFGHEIAAVVERVGHGVATVSPGQKVVLESASFCGHCDLCRSGRVDLCNKAPNIWSQPAMGFSRHMIAPAECLVPYEGLSPAAACLAEPAGVAYDMIETARIRLGERVAVVGPGPIGLMAAALALRAGAAEVTVIGRPHSRRRLDVARELGATAIGHDGPLAGRDDLARRFEHVLVTSPVDTIPDALSLLTYGGEMSFIGIGTAGGTISFDANDFHFRKLQLRASFASPAMYYPQVVRLLKAGAIPAERIISHRFPLERLGEAMTTCRDAKDAAVKVVVTP